MLFTNKLSEEIFNTTYRFKDETLEGMWERVSKKLSENESDPSIQKLFYDTLSDFKFVPGGRILSNAGTDFKSTTYINCFVSGFSDEDQDSMEGILSELRRQALILKSEGGYGFCCSVLRPRGAFIDGIGSSSPGSVQFLDLWDTQSSVITAGSGKECKGGKKKIRKGAQMVTHFCWHPDIEEFIMAKQVPGKLTKFNMSVLLTDNFMKSVEDDSDWELIFPDISSNKELYKKNWNGDINKWKKIGGKIIVYKTVKARDLYNTIMTSTYNRNEPGVIFIDTVNILNNLSAIETISASNPCGEQYLPKLSACLLGNINATQFIDTKNKTWDFEKIRYYLPYMIRMMDNVIDLTHLPLPEQYEEVKSKRRIGFGTMGLGSALMILKVKYGSQKSLSLIEEWFHFITNEAYKISSKLAKEKGTFLLWNLDNFMKGGFQIFLDKDTRKEIAHYGLRNSHITSCQPTGNTGILANNVSGGIEPVYMTEYIRTHGVDVLPNNVPTHDTWTETITEGDVTHKTIAIDNIKYKWNQNSGYTKESIVEDYAVTYLKTKGEWDPNADWASTTTSLSVKEHLNVMEMISAYLDSAMSKTININNDYPFDEFKNLYLDAWKTGTIKGLTTYRSGTMSAVLKEVNSPSNKANTSTFIERPNIIDADVIRFKNDKDEWIAFIGLINNKPFEIFTGIVDMEEFPLPRCIKNGKIIKVKENGTSRYDFKYTDKYGYQNVLGGLSRIFDKEYWNYARMVSGMLRHNMDIINILAIVDGMKFDNDSINSWKAGVMRSLKTYILDGTKSLNACPECGKEMIYESGCVICKNCGLSRCG